MHPFGHLTWAELGLVLVGICICIRGATWAAPEVDRLKLRANGGAKLLMGYGFLTAGLVVIILSLLLAVVH